MKSFNDLKAKFSPEPQIEIRILTPDSCNGCGIKTQEWMDDHNNDPQHGWIMVQLRDSPGIAILGCPNCGSLRFNPNALENVLMIQEFQKIENDRRIAVASGLVDPSGRSIGLKG